MLLVYIGLAISIVGMFLFILPFAINKCEALIKIGFLIAISGGILTVIGAFINFINKLN